jgi:hypothetical protein
MTEELSFSSTDIVMARTGNNFVLWDRDTNIFGFGVTYEKALEDLARNLRND